MSDLVAVTAHIPYARRKTLQAIAEHRGYTLHRFLQKLLCDYANQNALSAIKAANHSGPRPGRLANNHTWEANEHVMPSDANLEPLTETITVEIVLQLGQRLHSAARQMRDPSGKPVSPSWLARQLLLHFCHQPSDIMKRMKLEVNPDYVDHVSFAGRTKLKGATTWHVLPIKCSMDARNAVFEIAKKRGLTVAGLVRQILDKTLPAWPSDD